MTTTRVSRAPVKGTARKNTSTATRKRGPGESYLAQHPHAPIMWCWRNKWPLAPVALAGVAVAGAAAAPVGVALGMVSVAGVAEVAASPTGSRMLHSQWLSLQEWRMAAIGLAAAAGWIIALAGVPLPPLIKAMLLAAVLGYPATRWWASRKRPAPKLSPIVSAMLQTWMDNVSGSSDGPAALRGSIPDPTSVTEPIEGSLTMVVRLKGVHAANATSTALRRSVEVAMGLPADTVSLTAVRDDGSADRLLVTITPIRHLEEAPTQWLGPVLSEDGAIPIAVDPAGNIIAVHLWNKDGVEHGLISGTAGMGKGGSTVVVITPGVLARKQIVFYADGKRGMSAPELEPIIDRMATTPDQWGQVIDIVHAVLCDRETRYGARKLKRFVVNEMDDPIITLLLDEATTLANSLTPRRIQKVAEVAQRGRASGVNIYEVSQSVRSDMVVGGVATRDLLTGAGFSIAHKPGGASAARLATDGIQVPGLVEALQSLSPQAGMAVISRRNSVLATNARVFDAEEGAIAAIEEFFKAGNDIRHLDGDDLLAAGPAYTTGWDADDNDSQSSTPTAAAQDAPGDSTSDWVIDALSEYGPSSVAALCAIEGAPARASIYRAGRRLLAGGFLVNEGGCWQLDDGSVVDV